MRFIQLFHPDWDYHSRLPTWCTARCRDVDQPTAALITDPKQRGLLNDTLVIWGENSDAALWDKVSGTVLKRGAIIIRNASRCGWPVAA